MNYNKALQASLASSIDFFKNSDDNCYRIFNGHLYSCSGLTIDLFNNSLFIQFYEKEFIAQYEEICSCALKSYSACFSIKSVWYKDRTIIKDAKNLSERRESLHFWGSQQRFTEVIHNGCRFVVDLVSGQNPGLFMDMREVRIKLEQYYPHIKSVLNLFCYTSAFSVHARLNGVNDCINIDTSKQVLIRSKENYLLNGLAVDNRDFIKEDAGKILKKLIKQKRTFDLVLFDPPTFSRNKKYHFSVKNDYSDYLDLISKVSAGYALTAINSYSITKDNYLAYHPRHWTREFITHESVDHCNPADPYLKCALWKLV